MKLADKPIQQTPYFKKKFKERIIPNKKLVNLYKEMLVNFPTYRHLYTDHALDNKMKNLRSLYVDNDCRLVYRETDSKFIFEDIGTHKQVYITNFKDKFLF